MCIIWYEYYLLNLQKRTYLLSLKRLIILFSEAVYQPTVEYASPCEVKGHRYPHKRP